MHSCMLTMRLSGHQAYLGAGPAAVVTVPWGRPLAHGRWPLVVWRPLRRVALPVPVWRRAYSSGSRELWLLMSEGTSISEAVIQVEAQF